MITNLFLSVAEISLSVSLIVLLMLLLSPPFHKALRLQMELLDLDLPGAAPPDSFPGSGRDNPAPCITAHKYPKFHGRPEKSSSPFAGEKD